MYRINVTCIRFIDKTFYLRNHEIVGMMAWFDNKNKSKNESVFFCRTCCKLDAKTFLTLLCVTCTLTNFVAKIRKFWFLSCSPFLPIPYIYIVLSFFFFRGDCVGFRLVKVNYCAQNRDPIHRNCLVCEFGGWVWEWQNACMFLVPR